MIGFELNETQTGFRKMARDFAQNEIKPYAEELDRRHEKSFDWNIVHRFARANLLGLNVPREYGGHGADRVSAVIVAEELGAACPGIAMISGGTMLATNCLTLVGNELRGVSVEVTYRATENP